MEIVILLKALLIGVIQGLTEFLPVSSSGHLVLAQHYLGIDEPGVIFEVAVHFGTLVSVIIVFWRDIVDILKAFLTLFKGRRRYMPCEEQQAMRLAILIVVGSVPTAIIGFGFEDFFESLFSSVLFVGGALLVTGALLWLTERVRRGSRNINQMGVLDALIIGTMQGLAIMPGISRSGSTICTSLLLGLNRETATRYSFLLSIPAVFGASLFKLKDMLEMVGQGFPWVMLVTATLAAVVAGIVAILLVVQLLKRGKLDLFAYYCWAVGLFVIVSHFFF